MWGLTGKEARSVISLLFISSFLILFSIFITEKISGSEDLTNLTTRSTISEINRVRNLTTTKTTTIVTKTTNLTRTNIPKPLDLGNRRKIEIRPNKTAILDRGKLLVDGKQRNGSVVISVRNISIRVETNEDNSSIIEHASRIKVETTVPIIYDSGRLISGNSKRQINLLPSEIKRKIYGAEKIRLEDNKMPIYIVTSKRKEKLFGVIPVSVVTTYKIGAEDGKIIDTKKPFWSFFSSEARITLDEGDACPLNLQYAPCRGAELICEATTQGTVAPTETGECRRFPPIVHGKMVFQWDSYKEFEEFRQNEVPFSEKQAYATYSDGRVEVPLNKWEEWVKRNASYDILKTYFRLVTNNNVTIEFTLDKDGYFEIPDIEQSSYNLLLDYSTVDIDRIITMAWTFTVNDGPEGGIINLQGKAYNDFNKIAFLDFNYEALSLPPTPEF